MWTEKIFKKPSATKQPETATQSKENVFPTSNVLSNTNNSHTNADDDKVVDEIPVCKFFSVKEMQTWY